MKGISPLIAAVLLIAFTVAIATLIMGWLSTIARSTTADVTNTTQLAVGCSDARVSIRDVYVQAGASGLVNVIVENTGYTAVGIAGVQVYNTTGHNFSTGFTTIGALNKSTLTSFTITSTSIATCPAVFSKVIVTTNCGGISDTFDSTPKCG